MADAAYSILSVYTKVLKPLVGLRNMEQYQQYRKESADVGQMYSFTFENKLRLIFLTVGQGHEYFLNLQI
ncbi:hypothetical protein Zm00014a_004650 [Zea mays]|uniref:Uncharacterized protein n=1 Tax=Zea mays TaxID=4577 RepID=A0A3L6E723_MAIZE|nr:hypothetical protein Zm00014a_004650 [Zea mays]